MVKNVDGFSYLKEKFPKLGDAKIKELTARNAWRIC